MPGPGVRSLFVLTPALLAALTLSPSGMAAEAPGIVWGESLPDALDASAESSRPVMVDVWAVWCIPCKEMEETTYRDPDVLRAADGFVPLKVDADVKTAFIERYGIDAFPTLLFLDVKGGEITRWRGMITAEPLADLLGRLSEGYPRYLETAGRRNEPDVAREIANYLTSVGNAGGAVDLLRVAVKKLGNAEPTVREPLELRLGQAHLDAESPKAAAKIFRRLADTSESDEIRGQALVGLVRAERARGRDAQADEALKRLNE